MLEALQNKHFYPGWNGIWFMAAPLAVLAPLFFLKKYRPVYTAILCILMLIAVACLWIRNQRANDNFVIDFMKDSPTEWRTQYIAIESRGSGLSIVLYANNIDRHPLRELGGRRKNGVMVTWSHETHEDPFTSYPIMYNALFKYGGFQLTFWNEPEKPNDMADIHFWGIILPDWFVMLILSIPIILYARRFSRDQKTKRRINEGLCGKCGYDLRAHLTGSLCPECGTSKPASPAASQLSTATETQGKQK